MTDVIITRSRCSICCPTPPDHSWQSSTGSSLRGDLAHRATASAAAEYRTHGFGRCHLGPALPAVAAQVASLFRFTYVRPARPWKVLGLGEPPMEARPLRREPSQRPPGCRPRLET